MKWCWHFFLAVAVAGGVAGEAVAQSGAASTTELTRNGNVKLAEWVECETTDARVAAADTQYSALSAPAIAKLAQDACNDKRESWVESQVQLGWPKASAEHVADTSESCVFPIIENLVVMTRNHATDSELKAWSAAHANYTCPQN